MSQQVTWANHVFTIYHPSTTGWNDVGGIYIFCGVSRQNQWIPVYIGQADSFRNRIPSHEQWWQAQRLGATHIHAMVLPAASRDAVERGLIATFQPTLNVQHKGAY